MRRSPRSTHALHHEPRVIPQPFHRAVVAFFTSATCGPCRMIEPVLEEFAGGMGFAKIDLSVGLGGAVASEYQVRVTPTFLFFLDGRRMSSKGSMLQN